MRGTHFHYFHAGRIHEADGLLLRPSSGSTSSTAMYRLSRFGEYDGWGSAVGLPNIPQHHGEEAVEENSAETVGLMSEEELADMDEDGNGNWNDVVTDVDHDTESIASSVTLHLFYDNRVESEEEKEDGDKRQEGQQRASECQNFEWIVPTRTTTTGSTHCTVIYRILKKT
jgi:hypothetical protein